MDALVNKNWTLELHFFYIQSVITVQTHMFPCTVWVSDIPVSMQAVPNNMPARREDVFLSITMNMLMNENYMYEIFMTCQKIGCE